MTEIGEQKRVNFRTSMIETPFTFFEVKEKAIWANATQFEEAELREAPEAFDAVDMVFAPGEFVLMMMDAMVLIAPQNQAVVSSPAIGVDVAAFQDPALDNRQQLSGRAVLHDADVNIVAALVEADYRDLAACAAPPFAADASGTKIAFVDLHLSSELLGFVQGQTNHPLAQQPVKT